MQTGFLALVAVRTKDEVYVSHKGETTSPHTKLTVRKVMGAMNGFLWNMVRILAGTLMEIGADRRDQLSIPATLAACDRAAAGVTMPPEGLMLQWIRYGPPGSGRQRQLEATRHAD